MNKPTRFYSSRQEKGIAKAFNGKPVNNSGAGKFKKGDVEIGDLFLIEAKTKVSPSKSITIQQEWLDKIREEAFQMGKAYSALAFNFGGSSKNHYIISPELFDFLVHKLLEECLNG